ncbi:MAG TPA: purine-nucleoside phosphorylase, partial [Candidatus Merdenecus merdavium]|nr:purine-nucleoside phosphorylase [Candidatus Merdenecus merdavium]
MKSYKEKLKAAYEYLRTRISFQPSIGLVLGSGLGDYVKEVEVKEIIDYKDIPYFPQSTVEGHQGRFILGYIKGVP